MARGAARFRRACGALMGAALAAAAFPAGTATAQEAPPPVELQETGFFGMGARAMGMGSAYTAVSEDLSAILFNPAGLAQIRRVELSTGLVYDDVSRTVTHFAERTADLTGTRLDHVGLAYPVPTYRGSVVLAFAFHRAADLDVNYFSEGSPPVMGSGAPLFQFEDYQRQGTMNQWTAAGAMDLSPHLSLGATVSYLSGSSEERLRLAVLDENGSIPTSTTNPDPAYFDARSATSTDLDGFTGSLGILGYLPHDFRLGATVNLPRKLTYKGSYSDQTYTANPDADTSDRGYFENDITLPVSMSAGAAWGSRGLLLAAGLRWTDWRQIRYNGEKITAPNTGEFSFQGMDAYRSTVALNAGAEYQFPGVPLRVRGGFYTEPIPYRLIPADPDFFLPAEDPTVYYFARDYPEARIVSDRKYWTAGAGILVEESLTLDAAVVHGSWERATPAGYENSTTYFQTVTTREKVSETRVFVSTTLHFE